jgi:hypothetical protein
MVEYTYTEPGEEGALPVAPASPAPASTPPVASVEAGIPEGTPALATHVMAPSNDHAREIKETVFMQQPPSFINAQHSGKVLCLHKVLYDLRQAPRAWNVKLDKSLLELSFRCCVAEHGMYTHGDGEHQLITGVYVDDLIITSGNLSMLNKFKEEMQRMFKMSDIGSLSYYLRIKVHQRAAGITISQGAYVEKVLDKAGLGDYNPCRTQLEARVHLSKSSSTPRINATHYWSLVGSLQYLVNTRPDLAYSVGYVSRYMEEPREEHLLAVRRILRYIADTKHWGITYAPSEKGTQPCLVGFSHSDIAGDQDDRKSTSGMVYFLSSNSISWQSSKQKVVALSTCEAKYITASADACQVVWLARLMGELLQAHP